MRWRWEAGKSQWRCCHCHFRRRRRQQKQGCHLQRVPQKDPHCHHCRAVSCGPPLLLQLLLLLLLLLLMMTLMPLLLQLRQFQPKEMMKMQNR